MINQGQPTLRKIETIDFNGRATRESLVALGDALRSLTDYEVDSFVTLYNAREDCSEITLTLKKEIK